MNGHYRWCGWCCNLRYPLCCQCKLCSDCCQCPPPPLPYYCAPGPLPALPCLGRPPPPTRIIREQVIVPVPYPVYPKRASCLPKCWDEPGDPCSLCRPPSPLSYASCYPPPPRYDQGSGGCDPCRRPPYMGVTYKEQGMMLEDSHPCPWPFGKRVHEPGKGVMPGYKGHIPGLRFHAAGRSYGEATRDTCCIMSQWGECCPQLPCRIFEQ